MSFLSLPVSLLSLLSLFPLLHFVLSVPPPLRGGTEGTGQGTDLQGQEKLKKVKK